MFQKAKGEEMTTCNHCQLKEAVTPRMIHFEHRGLSFQAFKPGSVCDDCRKQEVIQEFEKYAADIVSQGPDGIVVDWEAYARKTQEDRTESGSPTHEMTRQLVHLDVLCHYPGKAGCWDLYTKGPLSLNPRIPFFSLLFTRENDAREYRRTVLANVQYPVYLRQIAQVESLSK